MNQARLNVLRQVAAVGAGAYVGIRVYLFVIGANAPTPR